MNFSISPYFFFSSFIYYLCILTIFYNCFIFFFFLFFLLFSFLLFYTHALADKGRPVFSPSDDRLQQKRRALQRTLGEDPQHCGALYAGSGAGMAVVIDHRHDAAETIVPDLCDRPGVNRKDEFMGLRFLPRGFQGHCDAPTKKAILAPPRPGLSLTVSIKHILLRRSRDIGVTCRIDTANSGRNW